MNRRVVAYAAAILAAALWGGNFVAVKLALGQVDPYLLTAARFAFVAALLPLVGWPSLPTGMLLVYSVCTGIGQYLLSTVAIQLGLSPGIAALLMQFQVFISLALSRVVLGETVLVTTVIGSMMGIAGLAGVLITGEDKAPLLASGVCLAASASWAVGNLILRRTAANVVQLQSACSLVCLPVVFLVRELALPDAPGVVATLSDLSASTWGLMAYIVIASFAIAQVLWGLSIKAVGLAAVAPVALLVPVCGMSFAWVILDERLSDQLLLWICMVLAGVGLHLVPIALRRDAKAKRAPGLVATKEGR